MSSLAGQTRFFRDKSLLKHYVGRDRDKRYNIMSVPAKLGRLALCQWHKLDVAAVTADLTLKAGWQAPFTQPSMLTS